MTADDLVKCSKCGRLVSFEVVTLRNIKERDEFRRIAGKVYWRRNAIIKYSKFNCIKCGY
jgi:hypothetical protein